MIKRIALSTSKLFVTGFALTHFLLWTACTEDEPDAVEDRKEITDLPDTCSDGIQNGDETGLDCGGPCNACVATIFQDFFERNDTAPGTLGDGWSLPFLDTKTTVRVLNQQAFVTQSEREANTQFAVVNDLTVSEENFTIEINANFPDNQESIIGLFGRLDPTTGQGYGMGLEDDQLKLFKFTAEGTEELQTLRFTWDTKESYRLTLQFESDLITGSVYDSTDRLIDSVAAEDSSFSTGAVGFIARSGIESEIRIDNFLVN